MADIESTGEDPNRPNIHFMADDKGRPMLSITPNAFYVRGKLVPQDESEAQKVYNAFVAWLKRMPK